MLDTQTHSTLSHRYRHRSLAGHIARGFLTPTRVSRDKGGGGAFSHVVDAAHTFQGPGFEGIAADKQRTSLSFRPS